MALPTEETLKTALKSYVDGKTEHENYIAECVAEAVEFIESRVPNTTGDDETVTSPLGALYQREVLELGAELFYRKMARNGVVTVGPDGNPIRISADPYKAAESRLVRFMPLGFG